MSGMGLSVCVCVRCGWSCAYVKCVRVKGKKTPAIAVKVRNNEFNFININCHLTLTLTETFSIRNEPEFRAKIF